MNIGFSTGSLAFSDFDAALSFLKGTNANVVELSALRERELSPLVDALDDLDLTQFQYVSFHAPSSRRFYSERELIAELKKVTLRRIPVVLHPDVIEEHEPWNELGEYLLIENMDVRKPIGRTASNLLSIFEKLPEAKFCFDLAHVRQVDPSMIEGLMMLEMFSGKLFQLHLSDVNTHSRHEPLNFEALLAYKKITSLIPENIPIVLESPVRPDKIDHEIATASLIFDDNKFQKILDNLGIRYPGYQVYSNNVIKMQFKS